MGSRPGHALPYRVRAVHPHASGEQVLYLGKGDLPRRFIPTRVGSRQRPVLVEAGFSVHPHASGEQAGGRPQPGGWAGSSPREWGAVKWLCQRYGLLRFIPTRVGSRWEMVGGRLPSPVHPHASGEQSLLYLNGIFDAGSSPREWGAGQVFFEGNRVSRFIPTRVGSSPYGQPATSLLSVHPHASGEQHRLPLRRGAGVGSSPREWGAGGPVVAPEGRHRFIPTRVGSSEMRMPCSSNGAVHPHASGEQDFDGADLGDLGGSSPREWGAGGIADEGKELTRFIPTRVGSRRTASTSTRCRPVHPHASGEQEITWPSALIVTGSSPREWGAGSRIL